MSTQSIPMYQGQDFSQRLSYFSDLAQTTPVIIARPVIDIRATDSSLLARFDTTGTQLGLITIPAVGVLSMTMSYVDTAQMPVGKYALDVFADLTDANGITKRDAITKRGVLRLVVTARITVDTP